MGGFENIRYWGDEASPAAEAQVRARLAAYRAEASEQDAPPGPVSFLALSGGGGDGAFGAGLLYGWTEAGDRPEFEIVTGVSTGAIIAPFAFLGPEYDDKLRAAYTEIGPADVYARAVIPNLLNGPALADAEPLRNLLQRYATKDLLRAVAEAHASGRRLLVVTTNLDAGRPVVWDLGAIASSGRPDALELFRTVILASSAIPGMFPPVPITVRADGREYTELHVDGAVTANVFAYQPHFDFGRLLERGDIRPHVDIYVIRNGRFATEYEPPPNLWFRVLARSLDVLLAHQAVADVFRIYYLSERDGFDFHLARIPEGLACDAAQPFDTAYMRSLFAYGRSRAAQGYHWAATPFMEDEDAQASSFCQVGG